MHINKESDYAVRIVRQLTVTGERTEAQRLADATEVSLRFLLKIMQKLVAADIVTSYKGAHGGYTLSRPASQITLREVIEAIEGPYRFSECAGLGHGCNCSPTPVCLVHTVFDDITRTVTDKLERTTFDMLV